MGKINNNFKVAIIGPYPPPYGGISIHVQRMHYFLQGKNIKHIVYTKINNTTKDLINIGIRKKWLLKYFFTVNENIIHFHSVDWRERVLMGLMGFFGKKVILSIHGISLNDQISQSGWLKKKILIWSLKNVNTIITINPKIKRFVISLGVKPEKVEFRHPFIPPIIKEKDVKEIPRKIWDFINTHKPIILANASKITFYKDTDLYGIDMCIDLCSNLKNIYPRIGFVFCIPDIGDYKYFKKLNQKIKKKKLENNFIFQTKPCQMYPVIMRSDLFVRPTNTDGYGISIAEAIYLGTPAIASNVCKRPEGTILFKNRDIKDFTLKVKDLLSHYKFYKNQIKNIELNNSAEEILKIYKKVVRT